VPSKVVAHFDDEYGEKIVAKDLHNFVQKESLNSIGKTRSTNTQEEETAKNRKVIED